MTSWLAGTLTVIVWHVPAAFDLAQRSASWHGIQDASFFVTGLLFWWPVVRPWPAAERLPRSMIPLYLFAATLPCDALSAFLVFCDRVVYGLTKNIQTYNPVRVAFHEYAAIWGDVRSAKRWRDRLGYLLRRPGWAPAG